MAAGRDMRAKLVLLLQDGISAGIGALQRRLNGLANLSRRIGIVGGALAGLSLATPIHEAAAYQDRLLQTQITAGGIGRAAMAGAAEAGRAYEALALQVGQSSARIAEAAGDMVAAGLKRPEIETFLPVLGRAATATGATMQDLTRTMIALRQNMGIEDAKEMEDTLGGLAQAGKEGMFELRDMAREFPQLLAAGQALGMTGREGVLSIGSMLQVVRQGAGSATEAANNLANFLQKISSPETVKNFKEIGVDLPGVLKNAAKNSINPVEAVLQKLQEKTGGDPFKLGAIFGDMQVLNALRPLLRGTDQYVEILKKARAANAGLITQDFNTRAQGMAMSMELIKERATQLQRRFGMVAGEGLGPVEAGLRRVQEAIGYLDKEYPGLVDGTFRTVAGFLALTAGLAVVGPAMSVLGSAIGLVLSPLGLLAGMALLVWKDWEAFAPLFSALWDSVKAVLAGAAAAFTALISGDFAGAYAGLVQTWEALGPFFTNLWAVVQQLFTSFVAWVDGWTGGMATQAVEQIKAAWGALTAWFNGLWEGIEGRFNAFVGFITAGLAPIRAVIDAVASRFGAGAAAPGAPGNPAPAQGQANARFGGRAAALYPPEAAAPAAAGGGRVDVSGQVTIVPPPGWQVQAAQAAGGNVAITGSRGRMLGRE